MLTTTPTASLPVRSFRIDRMPSSLERSGAPSPSAAPPSGDASAWLALQLPQCVCVYDAEGHCLLANGPLLRWLGRAEADVVGQSLVALWSSDIAAREAADLRLVLDGGRIEQVETRTGASGARPVRAVKFPWMGPSGHIDGMTVVFDELTASPADSLSHPEAIGRLALGIVHDFNNALTLLRGQLCLAEDTLAGLGRARGSLDGARQVLDHACQLPRQLLSFIRNEPMGRQRIDLNTLLTSLEVLLRPRLSGDTTLEFSLDLSGAWVEGDPVQLTQALLNLAGNALDAMPVGGRLLIETRHVALTVGGSAQNDRGDFVCVTLQDTGPGIAPQDLPRIFEPLYTTRPAGKGSGLGLAIVHEVIQRHGGWITCQSSPGQGARFMLYLPAVGLNRDWSGAVASHVASILILERDPDIRQLTAMILEHGPFHTETAGSLAEAKERASAGEGPFDLVLVSSDLCGVAGGAELADLLDRLPGARLLVTTSGQPPALPATGQAAYRGAVAKPYSAERLMRAVHAALEA
jgi:signal transduction histidine kinase/CheY-like chemotaxis protein